MAGRDKVTLTFEATGPGPDLGQRVRHLLKIGLRTCGLRNMGSFYDSDMTRAFAERLSKASEVLGRAAERLDAKQRRELVKEIKAVKADIDNGLSMAELT